MLSTDDFGGIAGLLTEPIARNHHKFSEPDTLPIPLDPTELIP